MYNKGIDMKGSCSMDNISELILSIFSVLLLIILIWFTYSTVNIFVTFIRCRKLDNSLQLCLNTLGKFYYAIITIIYILGFFGGIYAMITGLFSNNLGTYRLGLNISAFVSVVFGYSLSSIVLVGRKNMMVGRMMIDYRKLKKVNYTYENKMSFVYAQHDYNFSTRFVDKNKLRKVISK